MGSYPHSIDPPSLTFARTLYPFSTSNPNELSRRESEIVAIIGKLDPKTGLEVDPPSEVDGEWWKVVSKRWIGRLDPKKWIEVLQRRKPKSAKVDYRLS